MPDAFHYPIQEMNMKILILVFAFLVAVSFKASAEAIDYELIIEPVDEIGSRSFSDPNDVSIYDSHICHGGYATPYECRINPATTVASFRFYSRFYSPYSQYYQITWFVAEPDGKIVAIVWIDNVWVPGGNVVGVATSPYNMAYSGSYYVSSAVSPQSVWGPALSRDYNFYAN